MSQPLIFALALFTMLNAVAYFWRRTNGNPGHGQQDIPDPNPGATAAEFGERRLASGINKPGARNRLNDQVARMLLVLAAASFAIAIASRHITSW